MTRGLIMVFLALFTYCRRVVVGIILAVLPLPGMCLMEVSAAGFDCKKAQTRMEKLICADPALEKLDEALNASYKRALSEARDKQFLRDWQREWLVSFDVATCETSSCLRDAFSTRLDILNRLAPRVSPTSQWNGNYIRQTQGQDDDSASILAVALKDNRFSLKGYAFWLGNTELGQAHIGEIDGIGILKGNKLFLEKNNSCTVEIRFESSGLVVEKDSGCGGFNVTFEGTYKKY